MSPEHLKRALDDLGWPPAHLAEVLEIHGNTVWNWLHGKAKIPAVVGLYLGMLLELRRLALVRPT